MTQIQALRPGHRTKEQNRRAQAMSLILPGVTREPDRAGAGAALKKTRAIVRDIQGLSDEAPEHVSPVRKVTVQASGVESGAVGGVAPVDGAT